MITNLQAKRVAGNLLCGTMRGKTCSNQMNLVFSIQIVMLSILFIIALIYTI